MMKAITKLPVTTQMIVWMALGPFFLVATLSALLLQFSQGSHWISGLAIVGLFLSSFFRVRGFVVSAVIVIGYMCFNPPESLWGELCLVVPILAALFLTAVCMEEIKEVLARRDAQLRNLSAFKQSADTQKRHYEQEHQRLVVQSQHLHQKSQENEQWIASVKQLMAIGQLETAQTKRMRAKYVDRIEADKRTIDELKRKLKKPAASATNKRRHSLATPQRNARAPLPARAAYRAIPRSDQNPAPTGELYRQAQSR